MRRTIILAAAVALTAAACSATTSDSTTTTTTTTVRPNPPTFIPAEYALTAFDACDNFLGYVQEHALDLVGPWGLEGIGWFYGPVLEDRVFAESRGLGVEDQAGSPTTVAAGSPPQPEVDYSTTNVQEVGVDEADIWKTDGRRIVAVANGGLHLIDISGDEPVLVDSVPLDGYWAQELFLSGDRVFVMGTTSSYQAHPQRQRALPDFAPSFDTPIVTITEYSIADDGLHKVHRLLLDGRYLSARMVDGSIRVVLSSGPTGLEFTFPKGGGLKAERDATEHNRQVVEDSTVENWVPYYVLEDAGGDTLSEGALLPCDRAHYPPEFSGLQMLTVLTIDGTGSLNIADAVGVLAGGETVYASTDSLYVATQRWVDWEQADRSDMLGITTQIHQFDITDPSRATYAASGEVTGFLLNQFAMSEHEGYLRVASTTQPTWWGDGGGTSESMVTVLKAENGVLEEVGRVDGLGRGEQIFAVRMFGDLGYVVTFRQTDPLYVIDLSNPADPKVAGDLKILGYSAYLHPFGDGLVLGIGQDATEEGRSLGTQVSVFDVSDPNNPKRLHQYTLSDAHSDVEYDHRAFLQWGDLVVIPVQKWSWDEVTDKEDFFAGALVLRVSDDGIEEVGRVRHTPDASTDFGEPLPWTPPIQRSLVSGDVLYTLSELGVQGNALSDLDPTGFAAFTPFPPGVIRDLPGIFEDLPTEEGRFDQFPVDPSLGEWVDDLRAELEMSNDLSLEDFGFTVDEALGDIVQDTAPAGS